MTTVEKLLVQFFERKHSIIDLVKQQTETYSQHLACEFLIDGITPPSWLLDPSTSGSKEPSKEDLISKILRPYPRSSVCCSVAHYPGYTNLVVTGDNEEFSDGDFVENPPFNKDLDTINDLTAPGFSGQDNGECVLKRMPEFDATTTIASPEDQTDGRILNIYSAPDQSLAGIQRSKSRQKALELRSSAKALAKSGLRHESISDVVSSQIRFSLSINNQPGQSEDLSQSAEPYVVGSKSCKDRNVVESRERGVDTNSERINGSESYAEVPIFVKGSFPLGCSSENNNKNTSSEIARVKRTDFTGTEHSDNLYQLSAGPSPVYCQSFRDRRVEDADFLCENEETNVYPGESTWSGVSGIRQSCGCDSTKPDRSSDDYQGIDITTMDSGDQPPDFVDASLEKGILSGNRDEDCDARESVVEVFGRHKESDTFPSLSSIRRNACINEISNLEVSSSSAKIHGRALSSAGSARQVSDSLERSRLCKPSVGFFRRLTRSQTRSYDTEIYHPVTDNENPSLEGRKPISDCEEKSAEELQTTSSGQSVPPCLGTHNMLHEGCEARESVLEDFGRHKERDKFPSLSSIQRNACIDEISYLEVPSVSAKPLGDILVLSSARSTRQVNDSEELLGLAKQCVGMSRRQTRSQTRSYDSETYHPVADNENPGLESTKPISDCEEKSAEESQTTSSCQPPCLGTRNMLHDNKNGKLVAASELVLLHHVDQSCLSTSNYSGQRRGLESEVALTPSNYFASMEPKQLEFIETDGYNLKAFTSRSGNRSLDNLPQKMSGSLRDSDVSLVKGICGGNNQPTSSKQLLRMSDISTEEDEAYRDSFDPVVRESPDTHAENSVVGSGILNEFKESTEAELNCGTAEVQGEADNLLFKMVDKTCIQSPPVKLYVKHGTESSPVHCIEQGDCGDEGRDKDQLVSIIPERKNSRLSCVNSSAEDPLVQSCSCSIEKTGTNPIAINEVEAFSEHGDPSHGNKSLGIPSAVSLQGKNSSPSRIFTRATTESWPLAKRRKIELQLGHSFSNSHCFRMTKPHSFQRDPGTKYPKTMEVDVDTGLMEHVNMSMDDGICSEVTTDRMEGTQSAILSQHGEVAACYTKINERESTSPVNNNDQLVGTISSLVRKESRNSQGCFIEGKRASLSSCDYLDTRTSGDKQCSLHLRNLENDTDNLNSENLDLSSSLPKEQSPKWEDGLHVHHSVLSSRKKDEEYADVDKSMTLLEDGLQGHHSVISSNNEDLQLSDVDQSMPVFEGFTVNTPTDTGELGFAADGFDIGELELPVETLERASILAEICRSASLDRPSPHFASAFKSQETWNSCKSVGDDGLLENMELGNIYPSNPDVRIHFQACSNSSDEIKDVIDGLPYSVPLAYSCEKYGRSSRNLQSSPVGKLWGQLSSLSGSSGKCSSSNPELTCFTIEEDPSSSEDDKIMEENAGDTQDKTESSLANHSDKRQPLEDLTNMGKSLRADSVGILTSKLSVNETQEKALLGPTFQCRRTSETKEKKTSSIGAANGRKHPISSICPNTIKKAKQSVNNSTRKSMRNKISKIIVSNKTILKEHNQKLSLKENKRNNIVSNISSFIPLVQQKQAATDCTGKRDVKVKALEVAEAAKRLEERKENERKMRKEALKIERAKLEEKNLRDIELEKKRKEGERKKKDADIIAKKRLREEEERKEKEKKKMRVESRQRQREQEEKKRAERSEKESQRTKDVQMNSKKEFNNETKRQLKKETTKGEGVALQKKQTNLTLDEVVVNYEECGISGLSCEAGEAMDAVNKSPKKEDLLVQNSEGKSYEISPYQCSEDEDDEDDELPTKKYIPSWASKSSIAQLLPLQQELDPDVIFPPGRFCSIDAVLLPRKLQNQQASARINC